MKRHTIVALCLILGMTFASGCGTAADGHSTAAGQPAGAKSDLELDLNKSVYPYLVFFNHGDAQAEDVQVTETKSGQALVPLGLLGKSGSMLPATKPLNVLPGNGAQIQLSSKDALAYNVSWKENGHAYAKQLLLKEPQKIETH